MIHRIIFFSSIFLLGCSATVKPPLAIKGVEEANPLILTIEEEYRNADQLTIQGRLTSRGDWLANQVAVVKLISLHGGDIIGEAVYPVVNINIPKDESHSFTISVSAGDITDYQVSLLWGDDAKGIISQMQSEVAQASEKDQRTLILKDIETAATPVQCALGKSSCEGGITITATLENETDSTISKIAIGVKLLSSSGEEIAPEEVHELEGVVLPPHASRPLEVGIAIPEGVSSVDITASARLVDFVVKNQQK